MPAADDVRPSLADRLRLRGRHAVVTGAASGLGLAIVEALVEFGAHVTMIDLDDVELARSASGFAAGSVTTAPCDIRDAAALGDLFGADAAEHGGVQAVFANAGIAGGPSLESASGRLYELDWSQFGNALDVNLTGTLATVQAAARVMRPARSGSIVVTVSTSGLRGESMVGYGYNASKGALLNLVRQAAIDLARDGIRVNGIAPGPIRGTRIGGSGPPDPSIEAKWSSTVPMGRMGDLHEIQGLALLLASDASSFMTGAVIPVDGGATAGYFHTLPE